MKQFGHKNTFAIEYELKSMPPGMSTAWDDWGAVYFWVNGRNLFAFKNGMPGDTYHWHLFYLVRWFSESLNFIMDENDFPDNIRGWNSFEMLNNLHLLKEQYDEDDEEYWTLHDIIFNWHEKHGIIAAYGGSFLPDMYLRAVNGKIEIQWDNFTRYENREVKLLYKKGLEYVNRKEFGMAIIGFCNAVLDHLEITQPLEDLRESLRQLIKQIA
jgi:hypothetical protein